MYILYEFLWWVKKKYIAISLFKNECDHEIIKFYLEIIYYILWLFLYGNFIWEYICKYKINQIKKKLSMCESIIYNNLILYKNHKNNFFNIEIQMYVTFLAHNSWFVFIFYYFIFVYSQSTEANVQCDQFVHPKLVIIFYIVFFNKFIYIIYIIYIISISYFRSVPFYRILNIHII